jgi:hypothetical protein
MLIKVQNAKCLTELKKDLSLDEVKEIIFQDFFQNIIDAKNKIKRLNEENDGKYPITPEKILDKSFHGERINVDINNIEFEKSYSARELKEFYYMIKKGSLQSEVQNYQKEELSQEVVFDDNKEEIEKWLDKQYFYLILRKEDLSDIVSCFFPLQMQEQHLNPSSISSDECEKYKFAFVKLTVHFFKLNNKSYFYYTAGYEG